MHRNVKFNFLEIATPNSAKQSPHRKQKLNAPSLTNLTMDIGPNDIWEKMMHFEPSLTLMLVLVNKRLLKLVGDYADRFVKRMFIGNPSPGDMYKILMPLMINNAGPILKCISRARFLLSESETIQLSMGHLDSSIWCQLSSDSLYWLYSIITVTWNMHGGAWGSTPVWFSDFMQFAVSTDDPTIFIASVRLNKRNIDYSDILLPIIKKCPNIGTYLLNEGFEVLALEISAFDDGWDDFDRNPLNLRHNILEYQDQLRYNHGKFCQIIDAFEDVSDPCYRSTVEETIEALKLAFAK